MNPVELYEQLKSAFGDDSAKVLSSSLTKIHEAIENKVTKLEFSELKDITARLVEIQFATEKNISLLVEIQAKTETRLDSLAQKVEELAEAQKRTEIRLEELAEAQKKTEQRLDSLAQKVEELAETQKKTEQRLEELAEAQKKTEQRLDSLAQKVEELAEAQKKTEQRLDSLAQKVEELAEAQKKTEQRLEELAEAQKKTEQRLDSLAQKVEELAEAQKRLEKRVDDIDTRLGGLSMAVGYGIEDNMYPHIETLAKKVYGIVEIQEKELRKNIVYSDGRYDEVNIYIKGKKEDQEVYLIGECKAQPGKKDIQRFVSLINRLENKFKKEIFCFIVGYSFSKDVEDYLNLEYPYIKYFKTYQIEHEEFK